MDEDDDHDDNMINADVAQQEAEEGHHVEQSSLLDDVDNKEEAFFGTAEESGVMPDPLLIHHQTGKLDQFAALSSLRLGASEVEKKSSFLAEKHLIAGRSTAAARDFNNSHAASSFLDEKRRIAGRSNMAGSRKKEQYKKNINSSGSSAFLLDHENKLNMAIAGGSTTVSSAYPTISRPHPLTMSGRRESDGILAKKHSIASCGPGIHGQKHPKGFLTKNRDEGAGADLSTPQNDDVKNRAFANSNHIGKVGQAIGTPPGAVAVSPGNLGGVEPGAWSHSFGNLSTSIYASNDPRGEDVAQDGRVSGRDEEEGGEEHTINATLVDETNVFDSSKVVGSATVIDTEAEEKANKRKRMKAMVGAFLLASIIAAVIAISVELTRPGPPPPSLSPTMSAIPSGTPSSIPSVSPSTDLFGFLAEYSFDEGSALAKSGTPQYQALKWLEQEGSEVVSDMNYLLLQTYSLVTLFYATFGSRWSTSVHFDTIRRTRGDTRPDLLAGQWLNLNRDINADGICSWRGVSCNQQGSVMSLEMNDDRLLGSLPAELAVLHPSLSKCHLMVKTR